MQYLLKTLLALLILLLLLPLVLGVFVVANIDDAVGDGYAQWGATDMVINYMETHDGKWPPDWESLRPNFEANNGRFGGWTFERFQQRVAINFDADADELRRKSIESETVPFNVIHARSAFALEIGDGPNAMLHSYFRSKAGIVEAPAPRGGWRSGNQKNVADDWYRRGFYVRFDDQENIVHAWTALADRPAPGDKDVAEFRSHPSLKQLNLVGSHVTNAGLAFVRDLPQLEELTLGSDNITDAGVEHLIAHPRLAVLDIFGTQLTDEGLLRLGEMPKLRSIRFDETRFSTVAVNKLKAALPNLRIRPPGEVQVQID